VSVLPPQEGICHEAAVCCRPGPRAAVRADTDAPPEEALSVLSAYPADLMEAFGVSTAVNRAGRDAPEMVEPVAG